MTRTIIIAGTGVPAPLAKLLYAPLARAIDAEVVTLPRLGLGHVEEAGSALARRLLWNDSRPGSIVLVGHSQGGLVAMDLAYRSDQVVGVVTLGSPFAGTITAPLWAPAPGVRCMARASRYVATMADQWVTDDVWASTEVHNIVSSADRVVVPFTSGLLEGAKHYVLDGVGHCEMPAHPSVVGLVSHLVAS